MQATQAREFNLQTVRSGTVSRTYTVINCSKCPNEFTFSSARRLPDEIISKKIRSHGWLLSRDRQHDVCPACLGVKPENRLAEKFPTRRAGAPVPTPADCVDTAARVRDRDRAKTLAALDRLFTPPPAKPTAAPVPPAPAPTPAAQSDPRIDILQNEISQMRAAMELQLEVTQEIANQNRRLVEQQAVSNRHQEQLIEAVARMAAMTGRQNECLTANIGQVANALTGLRDLAETRMRLVPPALLAIDELPPAEPKPPATPRPKPRAKPISRFAKAVEATLQGRPKPPPIDEEDRQRMDAERRRRVEERARNRQQRMIAAE